MNESSDKGSLSSSDCAKVLVIDDEPINVEVIQSMLSELGFKSDQAMSGAQALTLIQQRIEQVSKGEEDMYRLVLLDFSMPEMDGPQVAIEIR